MALEQEGPAACVYANPFLDEQIITSAKVKDLYLYDDATSGFATEMLVVTSHPTSPETGHISAQARLFE